MAANLLQSPLSMRLGCFLWCLLCTGLLLQFMSPVPVAAQSCLTSLDSTKDCFVSGSVTLDPATSINFTISTIAMEVNYTFNATNCLAPPCLLSGMVLSLAEFDNLTNTVHNVDDDRAVFNESEAVQRLPLRVGQHEPLTVVFINLSNQTLDAAYSIGMIPFESCFVFTLSLATSLIVLVVLLLFGYFCHKYLCSFEKHMRWPYIAPEPIGFLQKVHCTIGFWNQQIRGYFYYWLQEDDILWIWFPEVTETLTKSQRAVGTITFLSVILLIQTVWSSLAAAELDQVQSVILDLFVTPGGTASDILARVVSTSVIITLIGLVYKPVARIAWRSETLWSGSRKPLLVVIGVIIKWTTVAIMLVVIALVILGCIKLLNSYTCSAFLADIMGPFFLTLAFQSIFPGLILRYFMFRLKNTFGKPTSVPLGPEDHSEGAEDREALLHEVSDQGLTF